MSRFHTWQAEPKQGFGKKEFDAEDFAQVVYNPETDEQGLMWPRTWFGPIIFLEEVPEKGLLANYNVLFADHNRFKDFQIIENL